VATGLLTALQIDAAAGLLHNQGIGINTDLIDAVDAYQNTQLIAPLANTIAIGSTGNILTANTIIDLETLAANTCPALSNSVPEDYSELGTQMTAVILNQANLDICGNSVSKLSQALDQVQAYSNQVKITTVVTA
jgi:hypothetical protein